MNRYLIVVTMGLASIPVSSSEQSRAVVERLVECSERQDTAQRLLCFDRLAEPFAASRVQASPAPTLAAPSPAPATPVPRPARAPSEPAAERASEEAVRAHIASQRELPPGVYVVSLDNGQSWRHENARQAEFLKAGDAVTISKGSLGTYRLTRDAGDAKNWIRVTRIR